jgi:hypothetical protein
MLANLIDDPQHADARAYAVRDLRRLANHLEQGGLPPAIADEE